MISRLAMTALQGMNLLNKVVALLLLSGTDTLAVFEPELTFAVWLLIKGVNLERWEKRVLEAD